MWGRVPVLRGLRHLLVGGAVRGIVVGPGLLPRPATPGWGVGACACLRVRPACTPLFLGGVCCVGVCAGLRFQLRPVPLGWVVGVRVRSCVCPGCPRLSRGAACGSGVCGCCRCRGLPPPSPLVFFSGALWCRSLVAQVLGLVVSVPTFLLFRVALFVVCCWFFFAPAWCVSACFGCPLTRWAPGAPFGGSCLRCRLDGRFGCLLWHWWAVWWLWAVLVAFWWLPVPPSAFPGLAHELVGILCGFLVCCWWLRFARPCPGPMGQVGYVHVGLGAPSCRVRFWLCRLGGCARRLRASLG